MCARANIITSFITVKDLKQLEQKLWWISISVSAQNTWSSESGFKLILLVWGLASGKTQLQSPNDTPGMPQLASPEPHNSVIWLSVSEETNAASSANYWEASTKASPTEGSGSTQEMQAVESSAKSKAFAILSLFGHIPHPCRAEPRLSWRMTRGNARETALVL